MAVSRLTTPPNVSAPPSKQEIADLLTEARERTLLLISGLSDEDLHRQHDPLMSPIIWDVGHIAHFEELWLTQNLDGPIEFSEMPGIYNPFEHPRAARAALALPTLAQMTERLEEIRSRVFDRLDALEWNDQNPLLKGGYVFNMVLQHEYQHNETILQTLQLKKGEPYQPPRRIAFAAPGKLRADSKSKVDGGMISFGVVASRSVRTTVVLLTTTSVPNTKSSCVPFSSTARPSPTPNTSTSCSTADTIATSCGPRRVTNGLRKPGPSRRSTGFAMAMDGSAAS